MDVEDALEPANMTEDQLRAEVWYWRERIAEHLSEALTADDYDLVRIWAPMLSGAVAGDEITKCFACNEALVPGQPCIRDVTEGEAHAGCMGTHIEGGRYQLDPESVCDEHDEPIEGHDGVLQATPYEPVRTTAQIARLVGEGWKRLGGPAPSPDQPWPAIPPAKRFGRTLTADAVDHLAPGTLLRFCSPDPWFEAPTNGPDEGDIVVFTGEVSHAFPKVGPHLEVARLGGETYPGGGWVFRLFQFVSGPQSASPDQPAVEGTEAL